MRKQNVIWAIWSVSRITVILFFVFQVNMLRECVISLVLSHHSKKIEGMDQCYSYMLQLSFIWQAKENTSTSHEGDWPKRWEEKHPAQFWPLFLCFFFFFFLLPLNLPCINWASKESCLFYLRPSLWSLNLPLLYFHRLFPFLFFSHRHSGLLFPIPTT